MPQLDHAHAAATVAATGTTAEDARRLRVAVACPNLQEVRGATCRGYGWEMAVTGVEPVAPVMRPVAGESVADAGSAIDLIPTVVCSGEVLSFEVLT